MLGTTVGVIEGSEVGTDGITTEGITVGKVEVEAVGETEGVRDIGTMKYQTDCKIIRSKLIY